MLMILYLTKAIEAFIAKEYPKIQTTQLFHVNKQYFPRLI